MLVLHKLSARDQYQRPEFTVRAEQEETTIHNEWFLDVAHFHLDGVMDKQNVQF
jgi:hypothetical protein